MPIHRSCVRTTLRVMFMAPILALCACGFSPKNGVESAQAEGVLSSARVSTWAGFSIVGDRCSAGGSVWVLREGVFSHELIRIDPDDPTIHTVRTVVTKPMHIKAVRGNLGVSGDGPSGTGMYVLDPTTLRQLAFEPPSDVVTVGPDADCWLPPKTTRVVVRRSPPLPDVEVQLPAEVVADGPDRACAGKDALWVATRPGRRLVCFSLPDGRALGSVNVGAMFPSSGSSPRLFPAEDGSLWLVGLVSRDTGWKLVGERFEGVSKCVRVDSGGHILSQFELDEPVTDLVKVGGSVGGIWGWNNRISGKASVVRIDLAGGRIDARVYQRVEGYGLLANRMGGLFEHAGEPWIWTSSSIRRIQTNP